MCNRRRNERGLLDVIQEEVREGVCNRRRDERGVREGGTCNSRYERGLLDVIVEKRNRRDGRGTYSIIKM